MKKVQRDSEAMRYDILNPDKIYKIDSTKGEYTNAISSGIRNRTKILDTLFDRAATAVRHI